MSSSPPSGFLSGWYRSTRLLYALLMSLVLASLGTPKTDSVAMRKNLSQDCKRVHPCTYRTHLGWPRARCSCAHLCTHIHMRTHTHICMYITVHAVALRPTSTHRLHARQAHTFIVVVAGKVTRYLSYDRLGYRRAAKWLWRHRGWTRRPWYRRWR